MAIKLPLKFALKFPKRRLWDKLCQVCIYSKFRPG